MPTAYNMREYGFSLTRILQYKNRIYDSVLIRENTRIWVSENPYSCIFYLVDIRLPHIEREKKDKGNKLTV